MSQEPPGPKITREGPSPKTIVAIVVVVLLVIFGIQNAESAGISILFWEADLPVWLVIVVSAGLGFVIGWLLGRGSGRRRAIEKLSD